VRGDTALKNAINNRSKKLPSNVLRSKN